MNYNQVFNSIKDNLASKPQHPSDRYEAYDTIRSSLISFLEGLGYTNELAEQFYNDIEDFCIKFDHNIKV